MTARGGKRLFLLLLCVALTLLFASLGVWQVERRAWKLDLIARVNARVQSAPAPVPARAEWDALRPDDYEYRRVRVSGTFRHDRETLVDALTGLGPGSWVVTPLETSEGTILVNRGFVPPERRSATARSEGQVPGQVTIAGLMRAPEPGGRFLRPNQPEADRWYSRDVAGIARGRRLAAPAPFFIDADGSPNPGGFPKGGLTVIRFRNTHLIYALTWFGLAALSLAGVVLLLRPDKAKP